MSTLEDDILQGASSMSFLSKPKYTRHTEAAAPKNSSSAPEPESKEGRKKSTDSVTQSRPSRPNSTSKKPITIFPPPGPVFKKKELPPAEKPKDTTDYSDYSDSNYSSYGSSSDEAPAKKEKRKVAKPIEEYPTVTAELRNNLLQCSSDLNRLIQNLCNENKFLNDMYVEIRDSPLAAEVRQQYEDAIAEWKEKFADLEKKYNEALDDLDAERSDNEELRKSNAKLQGQLYRIDELERDLKSASIRRDVVERELKEAQEEVDELQAVKRNLEAQLDDQKKQIRSLNIEVNTMRGELKSQPRQSRGNDSQRSQRTSEEPRESRVSENQRYPRKSESSYSSRISEDSRGSRASENSMVLYNRQPELPRRDEPEPTAIALYDYEGNRDFNSLPMRKGQEMKVIKYNNSRDWVFVSFNGVTTWEPSSYLRVMERGMGSERPSKTHSREIISGVGSQRAIVIADFEGIDRSEMTVRKGEIVQIVKEDGEWLFGTVGARKGWLPVSFIEKLK